MLTADADTFNEVIFSFQIKQTSFILDNMALTRGFQSFRCCEPSKYAQFHAKDPILNCERHPCSHLYKLYVHTLGKMNILNKPQKCFDNI